MKKLKNFYLSALFILSFILWTLAVKFIDIYPIGPCESLVGLSSLNAPFHNLTGVHMTLYNITDWAGLVPVAVGFCFAVLGLIEWITRKNILKVDFEVLVLGVFYILVLAFYLFFEEFPINYRPVLINGFLEASYPSSTTLLSLTIMPTACFLLRRRIKRPVLRKSIVISFSVFSWLMVIGRLVSGVHWITDIIGGMLLSASLVLLYKGVCGLEKNKHNDSIKKRYDS